MTCAFFALLRMIDNNDWEYIILPIGILLWGIFKFFDEDDREYLRRLGIDPDEYSVFFPSNYDIKYPINNQRTSGNTITWDSVENNYDSTYYNGQTRDHTRYMPRTNTPKVNSTWQNPLYKGMVKKCKRNFKITISDKKENEPRKEHKSFFPTVGSFGCC